MLDSGAPEDELEGYFNHVANWVNDGQTLKGLAPYGGNRQYGLRTKVLDKPFSTLVGNPNPSSPEQEPFRGVSTKSGANSVIFSDFEFDGSADQHFDHQDHYRSYGFTGAIKGNRFWRRAIRATGLSFGMDEDAEEQATYLSPRQTLVERVYAHNVVRNCILANRAPSVTVRDCRLADCDLDHLIYADRNPDLLVENTTFSGHALDALIVISSGTLRNCTVANLTDNPIPGLESTSVVSIRSDLPQPSLIENFTITGDLGALGRSAAPREVFRFSGIRNARLRGIRINHQGSPDAVISVFGAKANAGGITIEDVECTNMPPRARIWNTDKKIAGLSISNLSWSSAATGGAGDPLLEFGELDGAVIKGVSVHGASARGFVEGKARVRNVEIDDLQYPGAAGGGQVVKAPAAANVRYQRRKIF
jgi:hypothetical protein